MYRAIAGTFWLAISIFPAAADGSSWSVDTDAAIPEDCDGPFVERCDDGSEAEPEDQDTDDTDDTNDEED